MKKFYLIGLFIIIITAFVYAITLVGYGLISKSRKSELCVVLGNKVNPDGKPSPRLKAQLMKAIALYYNKTCQRIIVSGGRGKEGFNEAQVMKDFLIRNGVLDSLVVIDSTGYNTLKTALFVKEFCDGNRIISVIAVSQYFHLLRTKVTFI